MINLKVEHPIYFRRASAYALLLVTIGISLLFIGNRFTTNQSYSVIRELLPNTFWAACFIVTGVALMYGLRRSKKVMTTGLVASIALFTMWSVGLLLAFMLGVGVSFHSWALYLFLAYWGYEIATDPLPPTLTIVKKG